MLYLGFAYVGLFILQHCMFNMFSSVLDPHISYQGLLVDCGDDQSLKSHLELAQEHLKACY